MAKAGPSAVSDTVVISVRLGEAGPAREVEFSSQIASADLKEAILLSLDQQPEVLFRLKNKDGRTVPVSKELPSGDYTVEFVKAPSSH